MASKTKRRDSGAGGLYQDARGLWTAVIELPGEAGTRRRKVIRRKVKADALAALREAKANLAAAGDLPTSSPTLAQWLAIWLDRIAAPRLKPRTLTTYRSYVAQYIAPTIGRYRLDKLTQDHVRRLHTAILSQGLSTTTALQAHRILAGALTDAMRDGKVGRNVATLVPAPRRAVSTRAALDADDARRLLRSLGESPEAAWWSVALLAGLRQGERLGLTTEALDLTADLITVSWQLQRLTWRHGCGAARQEKGPWPCERMRGGSCPQRHIEIPSDQEATRVRGGLWLTRPKSRAGWRQVPIAPMLHGILEKYVREHPAGDNGLVFTDDDGHPVDPSKDSAAWDAALRRSGLPDVVLHSARHTCATLLHSLGVDVQTREEILGHSSATVTAGYTHISNALTREAMARLGALLAPVQIEG